MTASAIDVAIAVRSSTLTPTQRHVLCTIAVHAWGEAKTCDWSQADLAEDTGYSSRCIRQTIGELVEIGCVVVVREATRRANAAYAVVHATIPRRAGAERRSAGPEARSAPSGTTIRTLRNHDPHPGDPRSAPLRNDVPRSADRRSAPERDEENEEIGEREETPATPDDGPGVAWSDLRKGRAVNPPDDRAGWIELLGDTVGRLVGVDVYRLAVRTWFRVGPMKKGTVWFPDVGPFARLVLELDDDRQRGEERRRVDEDGMDEGPLPPPLELPSVVPPPASLWPSFLEGMRRRLGPQEVEVWFDNLEAVHLDADRLVVLAPNVYYRDWIQENYAEALVEELAGVVGRELVVQWTWPVDRRTPGRQFQVLEGGGQGSDGRGQRLLYLSEGTPEPAVERADRARSERRSGR